MSAARRRRAEFFRLHPTCCFCGGLEKATEEDHVPARSVFDERKWPEGYNFPACATCNRLTRSDENVVAFLSRIRFENDEVTDLQKHEIKKCLDAMRRRYPEAYNSMMPKANEVRKFLKDRGLSRPPGMSLGDIPVMKIGRPEFVTPLRNFGIKLFCALHYKHTDEIVPATWEIGIRFATNVQRGVLSEDIFKALPGRPIVTRAQTALDHQFHYIYGIAPGATASGFVCKFRDSFILTGIVSKTALPSEFDERPEGGVFKGFAFRSRNIATQ